MMTSFMVGPSEEYDAEEQHTICAGWCQFRGKQTGKYFVSYQIIVFVAFPYDILSHLIFDTCFEFPLFCTQTGNALARVQRVHEPADL